MKEVQELYTVNDKTLQSGNLRQGSGIIYSIHTYRLHCSGLVWASLAPGGSGVPVSRKWIRQWGNSRARQKLHYHFKPSLQSHAVLFPLYSVGAVTNFHSRFKGHILDRPQYCWVSKSHWEKEKYGGMWKYCWNHLGKHNVPPTTKTTVGEKKIKFKAFQDFLQNYSNTEVTNFKSYTTTLFASAELT